MKVWGWTLNFFPGQLPSLSLLEFSNRGGKKWAGDRVLLEGGIKVSHLPQAKVSHFVAA